jgi:hypothetical protein
VEIASALGVLLSRLSALVEPQEVYRALQWRARKEGWGMQELFEFLILVQDEDGEQPLPASVTPNGDFSRYGVEGVIAFRANKLVHRVTSGSVARTSGKRTIR